MIILSLLLLSTWTWVSVIKVLSVEFNTGCGIGCPMWPTRANQEPAYFWMILGANHMHCIKCIWVINQLKKSAAWLLLVWAMFCCVMIVRSHPVEYHAEGVLLLGRQADLCVLKAGRPTELIGSILIYSINYLLSILSHAIRFWWTVLITLI